MTKRSPEDRAIDAATLRCLKAMDTTLKGTTLPEEARRSVALCVGADCIMSAADADVAPSDVLLGTIRAMLETAKGKGWLQKLPPGGRIVLILDRDDEGVALGTLH